MSYLQAVVVLEERTWPNARIDFTGCQVETAKVLISFLSQSNQLGGTLVEHFWNQLATCHTQISLRGKKSKSNILQPVSSTPWQLQT
jgi:hypothetical protein